MKISFIIGTRPEAIKLAPVIKYLKSKTDILTQTEICTTGQHRKMLDDALGVFGISPDVDLNLMTPGQTLASFTSKSITALDIYMTSSKPDWIIVQGDTSTVFTAVLSAYYNHIQIGHVEAGLRTGNLYSPWPEEGFRKLTTALTHLHFAPTLEAKTNLTRENVADDRIVVTGNTVVDSLLDISQQIARNPPRIESLPSDLQSGSDCSSPRIVLITGHRRENFGSGFRDICLAISDLADEFVNVHFVYPVHLNPNVLQPTNDILMSRKRGNIHLIPPLDYRQFVALMARSYLILTDSGGVQEEAPSLNKPVLVMRENTERPEAVHAGCSKLVGANRDAIVKGVRSLLQDSALHSQMSSVANPYGDGHASKRIVDALFNYRASAK